MHKSLLFSWVWNSFFTFHFLDILLKLNVAKMRIFRWMCGKTRKKRSRNEYIIEIVRATNTYWSWVAFFSPPYFSSFLMTGCLGQLMHILTNPRVLKLMTCQTSNGPNVWDVWPSWDLTLPTSWLVSQLAASLPTKPSPWGAPIEDKLRENKLRWFWLCTMKTYTCNGKKSDMITINGDVRVRGRPKLT